MLRRRRRLLLQGETCGAARGAGSGRAGTAGHRWQSQARPGQACRLRGPEPVLSNHPQGRRADAVGTGRQTDGMERQGRAGWDRRAAGGVRGAGRTWLTCTAGMEAADTAEWLGELGSDLQGPMASCCFFRKATTFWATAGDSRVNDPSGEAGEPPLRADSPLPRACLTPLRGSAWHPPSYRPGRRAPR